MSLHRHPSHPAIVGVSSNWKVPRCYVYRRAVRNTKVYEVGKWRGSLHDSVWEPLSVMIAILDHMNVDIHEIDRRGYTAIHYAAQGGKEDHVKLLQKSGANFELLTRCSHSNILHCAAKSGNHSLFDYIMGELGEKANLFAGTPNREGKLPAHCACQGGNIKIFERLYAINERQHKQNRRTVDGRSFIFFAAERGHLDLIQFLYQNKKKYIFFKEVTLRRHDILDHAARSNSLDLLKFLIQMEEKEEGEEEEEGEESQKNSKRAPEQGELKIPMFCAASSGNTEMVDFLLEKGVSVNELDHKSIGSPISYAARYGSLEMVKHLLSKGAATTSYFRPLLHDAATGGCVDILSYLYQFNKDLQSQLTVVFEMDGTEPKTILHCAVQAGDDEALQFLVTEMEKKDPEKLKEWLNQGVTPFHDACSCGNFAAVTFLLKHKYSKARKSTIDLLSGLKNAVCHKFLDISIFLIQCIQDHEVGELTDEKILSLLVGWVRDEDLLQRYSESIDNVLFIKQCLIKATQNHNEIAVRYFIEKYPKESDCSGFLFACAFGGSVPLLKCFLEKFPNIVDQVNEPVKWTNAFSRATVLFVAVAKQHVEMVEYLVGTLNATVHVRDPNGVTPLHVACHPPVASPANQKTIIRFLINHNGWKSLWCKASYFPFTTPARLGVMPHDIAQTQEIRLLLAKYNPSSHADHVLTEKAIVIDESKKLGEGCFGCVYEGTYLGARVAVKRFPKNTGLDVFLTEVGFMSAMRHPCICSVFAASIQGEFPVVAMELMESNAQSFVIDLKKEDFPFSTFQGFVTNIASGLLALHSHMPPIIHRDLKLPNILISSHNTIAKITDLGVTRFPMMRGGKMYSKIQPPEHDKNNLPTIEGDVYMFGLCLYAMWSRNVEMNNLRFSLDIFSCSNPAHGGVEHMIKKCTARDPAQRYHSLDEILREVQAWKNLGDIKFSGAETPNSDIIKFSEEPTYVEDY